MRARSIRSIVSVAPRIPATLRISPAIRCLAAAWGNSILRAGVLVLVGVSPIHAQRAAEPSIVGVVAGYATTTGIWKPASDSEKKGGAIIGAFINAATPIPWFSIRAEGTISQRNSDVTADSGGQTVRGGLRTDYFSFAVHTRVSAGVGPIRVHAAAGPTIEQILRSRLDANLRSVLDNESSTVFGASASVGLGTTLAGRYRVEIEARVFEGLGDSYSGNFVQMRNRSVEFVTRVGIPRPSR